MKADIPATIPVSIVSANTGLAEISAKIVPPAGIDLYNEFVNEEPMTNRIGIATMSPTDHRPNVVPGVILKGCLRMLSSPAPLQWIQGSHLSSQLPSPSSFSLRHSM